MEYMYIIFYINVLYYRVIICIFNEDLEIKI